MNDQIFNFKGNSYKVSDIPEEQLGILNALIVAEQKIQSTTSELIVLQAGRESLNNALETILENVSPVQPQEES